MAVDSVIARAQVSVGADLGAFNTAMDQLKGRSKKAVQDAMKAIQDEMNKVNAQIPVSVAAGDMQTVSLLMQRLQQLAAQMDAVKLKAVGMAAANTKAAQSMANLGSVARNGAAGFRSIGYAVLMASQAIEDLQYGFSAIVNNIPMIAMAMGASAGWSGGLSIAAVAINQLITHWDKLTALFGQGKVKTQADEMEELAKKTKLTADEAERLARANALPDKAKEIRAGKTEEQQATEKEVTRAIIEAGPKQVVSGMLAAAPEMIDTHDDVVGARKERDEVRRYKTEMTRRSEDKDLDPGTRQRAADALNGIDQKLVEAEQKLFDARHKTAEDLANSGALPQLFPGGLDKLRDAVKKDPTKFGPKAMGLMANLDRAGPEFRKQERRDAVQLQGRKDIGADLLQADKEKAEEAGVGLTEGQKRIEAARQKLARAMEEDPYATGKIAIAEVEYQKTLEEQKKKRDQAAQDHEDRTKSMTGFAPGEEIEARKRGERAKRAENAAADRQAEEDKHETTRRRAAVAGKGIVDNDRYRNKILAAQVLGRPVDRKALTGQVEADLARKGHGVLSAKKLAPEIVADMLKSVEGHVQDRAGSEGVSTREAAYRDLGQNATEARRKAGGTGGFTDLVGQYQKLQHSQDEKDPYQQAIASSTQETAKATNALFNYVKANRNQGGGLAGPP